jgi:signal transduction histidine kinase
MGSLFLYIRSYLQATATFEGFVQKHNLDASSLFQTETWIMILILSVLVGIILVGLFIIYIYYSKVIQLYRQQQNFINGFTHELKTPIASMNLFLDAFSKHHLSHEEQAPYIKMMKKDIRRLSDNVEQILNLAKIEDKNYRSQFLSQDLNEFLCQFLEKAQSQFHDIELAYKGPEKRPWMVNIDRGLMDMVLMNLVSNAERYNESTSKEIFIELYQDGRSAYIELCDNGLGLERKDLKKIFKKFYQVGQSSKGNGLGLYIVSQITKLHKGHVSAHSRGPNQGLCIKIKLPLSKDAL